MKIRGDFVTNSSSCAFTILSAISGKIPIIHPNYKEVIRDLFPDMIEPQTQYSIWDKSAYFAFSQGKEEDANEVTADVSINNTRDYTWDGKNLVDLGGVTCLDISVSNKSNSEIELSLDIPISILERLLTLRRYPIDNAFLTYSAMPIDPHGAGWNGGDPMGPYAFTVDLFLNETKSGLIHIVGNEIFPKISKIGVDHSLLNEVSEIINSGKIDYENKK